MPAATKLPRMNRSLFFVIASSVLVACGGESTTDAPPADAATAEVAVTDAAVTDSAVTDGAALAYEVKLVGSGLTVGKTHFQLRVTRSDGKPATGLASEIHLSPHMEMEKMSHGNPVPPDAVKESAEPGLYDVTTFFTMASVDSSGNPTGKWTLNVSVGSAAPVVVPIEVALATGAATTHVILRNASDTITTMGMAKMRSWVLFRDVVESGKLVLFLATVQDGMQVWPPVTTGLKLVDGTGKEQLTVGTLSLSASSDGTSWTPMTCDEKARCTASLSTGSAVTVKMQVNGKDYTTDGAAPDATKKNDVARFVVTP